MSTSELAERLRMRLNKADGMSRLAEAVTKYYYVNGHPYSFKDHEWQKEVVDDPSLRIAIMKCSQVGASEALLAKVLTMMLILKNIRTIYTMPTMEMAKEFSQDRIDGAIEQSPYLVDSLRAGNNSASLKKIGSNALYIRGSFGYRSGISVPASMVVNDEIDSSNPAVIGLLSSRLRHAEITDEYGHRGIHYKFSTPTTEGSALHLAFMDGSQKHYMCKCEHCEKWTQVDFFRDFVIPGYDRDLQDYSKETLANSNAKDRLQETKILCEHCRRDLFSSLINPNRRQWVAKFPDRPQASYSVAPWDLPKYNTPYTIASQVAEYELKADYYNQVLGLPYSDSSNTFAVSEEHKRKVKTVTPIHFPGPTPPAGSYLMGMDVGKISHLSIGRVGEGGALEIVFMKKIENSKASAALPQVLEIFDFFKCVAGVVDAGPDITLVRELVSARPSIRACVYVTSHKGPTVYKENIEERTVNADRTKSLTLLMDKHNDGGVKFPLVDAWVNEAFSHISKVKKVRRKNNDGTFTELFISSSREDHWLHSIHYLNIAAELTENNTITIDIRPPVSVGVARIGANHIEEGVMDKIRKSFVW